MAVGLNLIWLGRIDAATTVRKYELILKITERLICRLMKHSHCLTKQIGRTNRLDTCFDIVLEREVYCKHKLMIYEGILVAFSISPPLISSVKDEVKEMVNSVNISEQSTINFW